MVLGNPPRDLKKEMLSTRVDREGQKRHVEKHIDQLILRLTSWPKAHRPKSQSGKVLSSASLAQRGVVGAVVSGQAILKQTERAST